MSRPARRDGADGAVEAAERPSGASRASVGAIPIEVGRRIRAEHPQPGVPGVRRRPASHVRILNHNVRTAVLAFGTIEALLSFALFTVAFGVFGPAGPAGIDGAVLLLALMATAVVVFANVAMGLYDARTRDGTSGTVLRCFLGLFLLAPIGFFAFGGLFPTLSPTLTGYLSGASMVFAAMLFGRTLAVRLVDVGLFRNRVLVLGTGKEASRILARMRRRSDRTGFELVGFVSSGERDQLGDLTCLPRFDLATHRLQDLCSELGVDEIVVAQDDRRRSASGRLPLQALLDCKMSGVLTTELPTFFERESGCIDVEVLRTSWLLFSDGVSQPSRRTAKRSFDLLASAALLLVTWPVMILAVVAIKLEDGLAAPVLYRQDRVGLGGRVYEMLKFRSMRVDAERFGEAVWAQKNDPRVTRVGSFMRKTRIDELPQLLNVLRGEMALVGPRPERPVFVDRFMREIPFYAERHRVKPGLTGWAQLHCPFVCSDADVRRKLEYDLYYVKNHSVLLDLLTLIRTVEVVLIGRGAP